MAEQENELCSSGRNTRRVENKRLRLASPPNCTQLFISPGHFSLKRCFIPAFSLYRSKIKITTGNDLNLKNVKHESQVSVNGLSK